MEELFQLLCEREAGADEISGAPVAACAEASLLLTLALAHEHFAARVAQHARQRAAAVTRLVLRTRPAGVVHPNTLSSSSSEGCVPWVHASSRLSEYPPPPAMHLLTAGEVAAAAAGGLPPPDNALLELLDAGPTHFASGGGGERPAVALLELPAWHALCDRVARLPGVREVDVATLARSGVDDGCAAQSAMLPRGLALLLLRRATRLFAYFDDFGALVRCVLSAAATPPPESTAMPAAHLNAVADAVAAAFAEFGECGDVILSNAATPCGFRHVATQSGKYGCTARVLQLPPHSARQHAADLLDGPWRPEVLVVRDLPTVESVTVGVESAGRMRTRGGARAGRAGVAPHVVLMNLPRLREIRVFEHASLLVVNCSTGLHEADAVQVCVNSDGDVRGGIDLSGLRPPHESVAVYLGSSFAAALPASAVVVFPSAAPVDFSDNLLFQSMARAVDVAPLFAEHVPVPFAVPSCFLNFTDVRVLRLAPPMVPANAKFRLDAANCFLFGSAALVSLDLSALDPEKTTTLPAYFCSRCTSLREFSWGVLRNVRCVGESAFSGTAFDVIDSRVTMPKLKTAAMGLFSDMHALRTVDFSSWPMTEASRRNTFVRCPSLDAATRRAMAEWRWGCDLEELASKEERKGPAKDEPTESSCVLM